MNQCRKRDPVQTKLSLGTPMNCVDFSTTILIRMKEACWPPATSVGLPLSRTTQNGNFPNFDMLWHATAGLDNTVAAIRM
jgi:hypothetical protein